MIGKSGYEFVAENRFHSRPADEIFAAVRMMGSVVNGSRCNFRLKDWRHRLCFMRKPAFHPAELWRVERRHLNHGCLHIAAVMQKLSAQRSEEPQHSVLGRAIGSLQRNAAISQRRSYVHNRASVARQHSL